MKWLVAAVLVLVFWSGSAFAQVPTCTITGQIVDGGGNPVANATVYFNSLVTQTIGNFTIPQVVISSNTDANGNLSPFVIDQGLQGQFNINGGPPFPALIPLAPQATFANVVSGFIFVQAGSIFTHTLTGAAPVFAVQYSIVPAIDVENEMLSVNVTSVTTPAITQMADGEIIQAKFCQPSGGHAYTLPASLTAGTGTTVVQTSGCPTFPTMPTGTNHCVLLDMLYNGIVAELDVVACPITGS